MSLVKTFYYETRQLNATAIYIIVSATFQILSHGVRKSGETGQWFCIRSTDEIE